MCGHEEDGAGTSLPPDTFTELALTIKPGMVVEFRQWSPEAPPYLTINGRLRLFFETWDAWNGFVAGLDAANNAAAKSRHARRTLQQWSVRL